MAAALPRFIAIHGFSNSTSHAMLKLTDPRAVVMGAEGAFSFHVKIEVEPSKDNDRYVHLRFCRSNRYWHVDLSTMYAITAFSTEPVEDIASDMCTLFEPTLIPGVSDTFTLTHVRSGSKVEVESSGSYKFHLATDATILKFVNWEALVKLPGHVAFKGYNGQFLQGVWAEDHQYLQFAADDPNSEVSGHRVYLQPDGYVRIKSDHFNRYWQYQHDWIYASSPDPSGESNTLFMPIKLENNTIALRCFANNRFCKSLDYEGKTRCLNAGADTIVKEARIEVQELVSNRKIYNVKYRMEDARIYDEKPYLAGVATATNNSDQEAQVGVSITYEDSRTRSFSRSTSMTARTRSFSRSTSMTAGVSATIEAGIPLIEESSIEISFSVTEEFEWGKSETTTFSDRGLNDTVIQYRTRRTCWMGSPNLLQQPMPR